MPKGRDAEKLAVDLYTTLGYETYLPPKAKYREQDVFGVFDLLAFGHDRLEAVQVKAGRDAAGIESWFDEARPYEEHLNDLRLAFHHRKDGAWRIARSTEDGWAWVYDGREEPEPHALRLRQVLVE